MDRPKNDLTALRTERVHKAWSAMLNDIRGTGAKILQAEEGGALQYSVLVIARDSHADLSMIEARLFDNLLFHPMSLAEKHDRWEFEGAQLWNERPKEQWTREASIWPGKQTPYFIYKLPTPFTIGG